MPAHTSAGDVGTLLLGNGEALTAIDRNANAIADIHAKVAPARYVVGDDVVAALEQYEVTAARALKWLGMVSWHATHATGPGARC